MGLARAHNMPIRVYLEGQRFDAETIRLMGIAFEIALASLDVPPNPDNPIRAALAHNIIALAKAGEHDPERLCDGALRAVRPLVLPRSSDPTHPQTRLHLAPLRPVAARRL
jgi:hypothetical protein